MTPGGCGTHAGLADDLRAGARLLLERLRAIVGPPAQDDAAGLGSVGACTACPVCALVAALRGERSDLAAKLAGHATGLLTVLAAVLEETEPQPARPPSAPPSAPNGHRPNSGRSVQRIMVHRT